MNEWGLIFCLLKLHTNWLKTISHENCSSDWWTAVMPNIKETHNNYLKSLTLPLALRKNSQFKLLVILPSAFYIQSTFCLSRCVFHLLRTRLLKPLSNYYDMLLLASKTLTQVKSNKKLIISKILTS